MIAPPPPPIVSFAQLPAGWHQFRASAGGGAYALSWRYRPRVNGWASSMPRNAIAVQVFFPDDTLTRYPRLRLVMPRSPATFLKGAGHAGVPDSRSHRWPCCRGLGRYS